MIEPVILVLTAVTMFMVTNLDDLFILTLFFANKDFNAKHVILGQYLGVIALILISTLSYFLKFVIPVRWIGLLGILPILIGLKNLRELNKPHSDLPDIKGENRSTFYKLKNSNTFFCRFHSNC